jgi:ABC-type polysaccharide/polyol phosphate export permease
MTAGQPLSSASSPLVEYDSAARPPRAIEELCELRGSGVLLRALVERNVKVRYKRSAFGLVWTMVSPTLMLVVLSLVFTRAFAAYAPAYPAFLFPGLLLWNFFAQTTVMVGQETAGSGDLWRRLRFPKTALAISTLLTNALNLAFAAVPLIVVLAAARRPLGLALLTLPLTVALAALFILGVSLIIATAALYFPDVIPAWNMLLPALMFTAPVIYPPAILPAWLQLLVRANPMTLYVDAFRGPLYTNNFDVTLLLPMTAVAMATLAIGWLLFTWRSDDIAYRA